MEGAKACSDCFDGVGVENDERRKISLGNTDSIAALRVAPGLFFGRRPSESRFPGRFGLKKIMPEKSRRKWDCAILAKELAFYRWNAKAGGVYLPVSERIRPDPKLADVPDRDIRTPSGLQLTLTKPSVMMTELEKISRSDLSYKSHLVAR